MSETPPTEPTSAAEEITESAADPSPESDAAAPADEPLHGAEAKHSASAPRASKVPLWIAVAALVLALVSTGLAVAGYFYYPHKGEAGSGTFSDQQTKDAKKKICETFIVVDRAVVRNSHAKLPPETGPLGQFTVGIAARQAFLGGAAYLRDQVSQTPATPSDLAKSVDDLATSLQTLAISLMAGGAGFAQDELIHALDDKINATKANLDKLGALDHRGERVSCKNN